MLQRDVIISLGGIMVTRLMMPRRQRSSRAARAARTRAARITPTLPTNARNVMPGLVPGIHVGATRQEDVDGRDKPGHDENAWNENTWNQVTSARTPFADPSAGTAGRSRISNRPAPWCRR